MSTEEDPPGPAKGPALNVVPSNNRAVRIGAPERAQARREALKAVLRRADITAAELARRAGLPNANLLYNFLSKRSHSLSQITIDRLLAALPDVTQAELTGHSPPDPAYKPGDLWAVAKGGWPVLTAEAQAGVWGRSAKLPPRMWRLVPLPSDLPPPGPSAFAVRLLGAGADGLYPVGTIAICLPLEQALPLVRSGCRVLVHRERARWHELTAQELVLEHNRAVLWPHSSNPAHQAATILPWPLYGPVAIGTGADEVLLSIEGIIVATWQPEAALGLP